MQKACAAAPSHANSVALSETTTLMLAGSVLFAWHEASHITLAMQSEMVLVLLLHWMSKVRRSLMFHRSPLYPFFLFQKLHIKYQ